MSAHEIALGLQFLTSTLSGDSALMALIPGGIKRGYAPPGTATPYLIIGHQGGADTTTANGVRLMDDLIFQAKAVGPASVTDALAQAASRVDVLLGGTSDGPVRNVAIVTSAVTIGWLLACWRESPLFVDELVEGVQWSNAGGLYRMQLEQVN